MTTAENCSPWLAGRLVLLPAALVLLVAACAGNPPRQTLSNARLAVEQAAESDGHQYAPLEMRLSRDRLAEAEEAMEDEDYEDARQLAEKATVDAQLAEAKAEAAKAQAGTTTLRRSVETLSPQRGAEGTQGGARGSQEGGMR